MLQKELNLAKNAFVSAHGRFLSAHAYNIPETWYASLGETLWWIFALDDYYKERHGQAYISFRDASPHGSMIPGLKLARNSIGHGLELFVDYGYAELKTPENSVSLKQLQWRQLDQDIEPEKAPSQKSCYKEHLAGNAVRYSLRRANYFFIRQRDGLDVAMEKSGS